MLHFVYLVNHYDFSLPVFVQSPSRAHIKFCISPTSFGKMLHRWTTIVGRTTSYHTLQVLSYSDSDQQSLSVNTSSFSECAFTYYRSTLNLICHFSALSCCFLVLFRNSLVSIFILPTLKYFLPSSDLIISLVIYFSTHILAQSPPTDSDLP